MRHINELDSSIREDGCLVTLFTSLALLLKVATL